jgi:heterotetrameric sarcosine oxidase beta subunit
MMSNAVHVYVSQAHKGELVLGAGIDSYVGYGQRGAFHIIEEQMAAAVELFPIFARAHVLRTWAGIVDVTPDASPIISKTAIGGLYLDCGWGTGGFKATPSSGWVLAHTVANGEPHELNRPYGLERFQAGIAYPKDPDALTDAEWVDYLFLRDNPKGPFRERWVHSAGCRRWFEVTRDTVTNAFDRGR